jgi:flagellar basal-body rod modification protein FlgD
MDPITSAAAGTTTGTTTQTPATSKAKEQQSQFLQLLVAQIKGQNPLDPMQGSEFVSQLAQFSSLEQLTHISGSMDSVQQLLSTQNQKDSTDKILQQLLGNQNDSTSGDTNSTNSTEEIN